MKVFCRYVVVDIKSGAELACGRKFKDFENSTIRYIYDGVRCDFPFFWRKYPCYYRTIEIKNRHCLIYYWVEKGEKSDFCNYVYLFKDKYFLRGLMLDCVPPLDCSELVEELGV